MAPLYEYRCESCSQVVELIQGYDADEIIICTCGAEAKRAISQTGPWNFGK